MWRGGVALGMGGLLGPLLGLGALILGEEAHAEAPALGGDLEELVVGEEARVCSRLRRTGVNRAVANGRHPMRRNSEVMRSVSLTAVWASLERSWIGAGS